MAAPLVPPCYVAECVAIEPRGVEIFQSMEILGYELIVGDCKIVSVPLQHSAWIVSFERAVIAFRHAVTCRANSVPAAVRMSSKAAAVRVTTAGSNAVEPSAGMQPATM
jgi:hypothetical protein